MMAKTPADIVTNLLPCLLFIDRSVPQETAKEGTDIVLGFRFSALRLYYLRLLQTEDVRFRS